MSQQYAVPAGGFTPPGYELVNRYAIVRLGSNLRLHTDTNHASLGVTGIANIDGVLTVYTDCTPGELTLHASANIDATLAAKGVFVGASGGGAVAKFPLYSARNLRYGSASVRKAWVPLPPNSGVFNTLQDNLWIHLASLRPTA